MAIKIDIETSQVGVPFSGAYFRIVTAMVQRQRTSDPRHTVMIDVAGYATSPEHEDVREVDMRRYFVPLDVIEAQAGSSFLAKCYSLVITQPDMVGAVGV